jgi:regulator of sigma E protease
MPAAKAGLQAGDRIVRIDGELIEDFEDLRMAISMHAGQTVSVEYLRGGKIQKTTLTPKTEDTDYGPVGRAGFSGFMEPVVGGVTPGSTAERSGFRTGDRFVMANGKPVHAFEDMFRLLDGVKGAPVALVVRRGHADVQITLAGEKFDPDNLIRGLLPPFRVQKLSLGAALVDSTKQNAKMLKYTFLTLGRLFRGHGSMKELSGPISIARISGEMFRRGWIAVIGLMAMISLQLGIMNLLPIPVLDGGHIFILLIEGVARRDLSLQMKERIQQLGFAVLAAIMLVVIYNDVITNVFTRKG